MMTFTREQVLKTWAKYGTGEPLTEEKLAHMLKVLNEPLTLPKRLAPTLCGKPALPRYSFRDVNAVVHSRYVNFGPV
jgi:hypothetical protein